MWFTVPICLCSSEPLDGEVFVEEVIHLFEATSGEGATAKAKLLAERLEHRYTNVYGREVAWTVERIGEPWELMDDLKDGAEVYSRFISGGERVR